MHLDIWFICDTDLISFLGKYYLLNLINISDLWSYLIQTYSKVSSSWIDLPINYAQLYLIDTFKVLKSG